MKVRGLIQKCRSDLSCKRLCGTKKGMSYLKNSKKLNAIHKIFFSSKIRTLELALLYIS
jgi:hypothetical protein